MDSVVGLRLFIRVVEAGSFSMASVDLGLTQPTATKHVAAGSTAGSAAVPPLHARPHAQRAGRGRLRQVQVQVHRAAARGGDNLGALPWYVAHDAVRAGALQPLLSTPRK
ncbi:MAG TPA: LysR family transcriptional regulator [Rubrivivax sp.]|nr:LysR family transcriptional regulator [Rubrivivax sp.]